MGKLSAARCSWSRPLASAASVAPATQPHTTLTPGFSGIPPQPCSAALLRGSAHNYHSRRPTPSSRLLPHVETLMLVKLSCLQLPGERCLIVANGTTTMTFSLQMTDSALSV